MLGRRRRHADARADQQSMPARALPDRPPAVPGSRNLVVVGLDSLRYDVCTAARMPHLARLGDVERRSSYASWPAPSHHILMMGLMPHDNPTGMFASEHYRRDIARYSERLGVD